MTRTRTTTMSETTAGLLPAELVPVIMGERTPLDKFTLGALPSDDPSGYKVRDSYNEENWITYIGPVALIVARKMDVILSSNNTQGVVAKRWAAQLGVTVEEFTIAVHRLARYGLGEWQGQSFLLRRH